MPRGGVLPRVIRSQRVAARVPPACLVRRAPGPLALTVWIGVHDPP